MPRKPKTSPPVKGDWLVTVRVTVVKTLSCVDCTEEEARSQPYEYMTDEVEGDQEDWKVLKVEAND